MAHYAGPSLWIPGAGTLLLLLIFTRTRLRPKYFRGAICTTGGHVLWFVLASVSLPASLHAVPLPTQAEVAETAEWFNGLEWPDIRGKPYFEFEYGHAMNGPKTLPGPRVRGFLLAEDDQGFTIFGDGTEVPASPFSAGGWPLVVQRIPKGEPVFADFSKDTHRTMDLSVATEELMGEVRRPKPANEEWRNNGDRTVSNRTSVFIFARCCERQGRKDLAERLDTELRKLTGSQRRSDREDREPFRIATEKEIAYALLCNAVLDFGRPAVTRRQLLTQLDRITRDFPASDRRVEVMEAAAILRKMVAEDAAHAGPPKPLASMTADEKAREWIFRLRDQNGHQYCVPGACDIFADLGKSDAGESPGHQLVRLGYAAVPALIEALDDPRLSRSLHDRRNRSLSGSVMTVGDCALQVLSRIAGRENWLDTFPSSEQERREAMHAAVNAWWQGVQARGGKEMLLEGVRSGGGDSLEQAQRLARLDAPAAVDAIVIGLAAPSRSGVPHYLMETLASIKSEAATVALRREMRSCADLEARVIAASELFRRGEKETLPAMIGEWKRWEATQLENEVDAREPVGSLIVFLGTCGDVEARAALAAHFPTLPVGVKCRIIEAVTGSGYLTGRLTEEEAPMSAEAEAVAEELAVGALEDRAVSFGNSFTRGRIRYQNPRVCDRAADALASRWPERYAFPWSITRQERDVQVAKVRNAWRVAHHLAERPLPEREAAASEPNVVAAVKWTKGRPLAGLPIAGGRPLTAGDLIATIIQLHRDLPRDCQGFDFYAERPGDRPGFVVEIDWQPGVPGRRDASWGHLTDVSLDGKFLYESGGGSSAEYRLEKSGYEEAHRAISQALAAAGNAPVAISFSSHLNRE